MGDDLPERVGGLGRRIPERAADTLIVLAVALATSARFITAEPGGVSWAGFLLNAGTVVPLLWRRQAPFAVMVIVAACATLVSLHDRPGQNLQYGGLVAIYTVAALGRRRWQRLGILVAILVTFPPASLLLKNNSLDEFTFTILLPLAAFVLGSLHRSQRLYAASLRERADQLERQQEAERRHAAAEERARIARDMHDILAHAVSLMVVQAEAGPVVVRSDPVRAERAFAAIADAGRDAMTQLRRLLGVLSADGRDQELAPQPALAALSELTSGRAELQVTGMPRPLEPDTEIAAYRIVQEALTNTTKHAAGARTVTVQLSWQRTELVVTVTDDGRPGPRGEGGHGLIGIKERATAAGGGAAAGPVTGGGWQVRAVLPYDRDGRR